MSEPSGNRPAHASHRSRKGKPKFEVPQEAGLPEAATWVYRAADDADVSPPETDIRHPEPPRPESPKAEPSSEAKSDSLLSVAVDLMATGFKVFAQINAVALNVMAAPFRLMGRFF